MSACAHLYIEAWCKLLVQQDNTRIDQTYKLNIKIDIPCMHLITKKTIHQSTCEKMWWAHCNCYMPNNCWKEIQIRSSYFHASRNTAPASGEVMTTQSKTVSGDNKIRPVIKIPGRSLSTKHLSYHIKRHAQYVSYHIKRLYLCNRNRWIITWSSSITYRAIVLKVYSSQTLRYA